MLTSICRLVVVAPLLFTLNCQSSSPKTSTTNSADLDAANMRLSTLERRMELLEEKTGQLDGVAEGVSLLLKKLDSLGGEGAPAKRPRPSSTAIYSVPIDGDPFVGPRYAKVTVVKGYDFYCSYCDKVRPTLSELQKQYGKDLKVVFKNFVIKDRYARLPAIAACAAHQQGKFMPMFEKIWERGLRVQQELDEEKLRTIAKTLGLNLKKLETDMRGICEEKIREDFEIMSNLGATGTPAFFINGRFLSGAQPIGTFKRIIDQELAKASRALSEGAKLPSYYQGIVKNGRSQM